MAGQVGNPNHDPKTGKFASKSGLNKTNSTLGQRGKARIKEAGHAARDFVIGAAGIAAAGVGYAALRGVTVPVSRNVAAGTQLAINHGVAKAAELTATHGPKIASAIKSGGSTLLNHVKNMKAAGETQHKSSARVPFSPKPTRAPSSNYSKKVPTRKG